MWALFNQSTKIYSQYPYCTTHKMIEYMHLRHQRHAKLPSLTIIRVQLVVDGTIS